MPVFSALLLSNSVLKAITMIMEMIDEDDAFDTGGLKMMHLIVV